jgi:hypothetical protein
MPTPRAVRLSEPRCEASSSASHMLEILMVQGYYYPQEEPLNLSRPGSERPAGVQSTFCDRIGYASKSKRAP